MDSPVAISNFGQILGERRYTMQINALMNGDATGALYTVCFFTVMKSHFNLFFNNFSGDLFVLIHMVDNESC